MPKSEIPLELYLLYGHSKSSLTSETFISENFTMGAYPPYLIIGAERRCLLLLQLLNLHIEHKFM
ncbi:MAG: hypothetical protein DRJ49_07705 [Thermoprotei archaeon]|nr:MAG: hypothetical protein DRJ49_07705 [Thermoprotei archaeon]